MNVIPPGNDFSDVATREESCFSERQIAERKVRTNRAFNAEIVVAMQAGTRQYLKSAGERMLMDGSSPVQPEIEIDIKPRAGEKGYGKVAKASLNVLLRRHWCGVDLAEDVDRVDSLRSFKPIQSSGGDVGESDCVITGFAPVMLNRRAHLLKKPNQVGAAISLNFPFHDGGNRGDGVQSTDRAPST